MEGRDEERVEILFQGAMVVVRLDACGSQAKVRACSIRVKVVGDVLADDGAVRIVERQHQPPARLEDGGKGGCKAAVVLHVVQRQLAGSRVEAPGKLRQPLAQVGHPVLDLTSGVLLPGHLDEARREVDPRDARTTPSQHPG